MFLLYQTSVFAAELECRQCKVANRQHSMQHLPGELVQRRKRAMLEMQLLA